MTKFAQKGYYFQSKTQKIEFQLKLVFSFCGPNLPKNGVLLKIEKITTTTEFCKLQLVLQFQPKLIILLFWTKLAEKGYFGFKT